MMSVGAMQWEVDRALAFEDLDERIEVDVAFGAAA